MENEILGQTGSRVPKGKLALEMGKTILHPKQSMIGAYASTRSRRLSGLLMLSITAAYGTRK